MDGQGKSRESQEMNYEPGDLLLFYGDDLIGKIIRYGTFRFFSRPAPSHIGIVCHVNQRCYEEAPGGEGVSEVHWSGPLLIESTTLCPWPCAITGRSGFSGVQGQFINRRLTTYDGRVELMRLNPIYSLDSKESELLTDILVHHLVGLPYEQLRKVVVSGSRLIKWLPWNSRHTRLNRLFCSEMVAAVLMRLCRMNKSNPEMYNPADVVSELLSTGVYQDPITIWE